VFIILQVEDERAFFVGIGILSVLLPNELVTIQITSLLNAMFIYGKKS